jgi:fucose permease
MTEKALFIRTRTTWLGYAMLGYFTMLQAMVSSLMPFLRAELHLNYTDAGLYMSVNALGMGLAGLTGDRLAARLGRRAVLWAGAGVTVIGGLCLALGQAAWVTLAGAFINGYFGALTQVMVQATLSDLHGERKAVALTEANIASGVGSLLAPLLVGGAVTIGLGWRAGPGMALALLAICTLIFYSARFPKPQAQGAGQGRGGRLPTVYWVLWLVLYLSVAVEWCVIFWSPDFLEKIAGFSKTASSTLMSVFFVAYVVGRFAVSRLVRKVRALDALFGVMGLAGFGILVFWLAPVQGVRVAALFVSGLGIANLYPLAMVEAVSSAPGASNAASARATLAAGSAIFSAPLGIGWIADQVGIRNAYGLALIILALAAAAALLSRQALRRAHPAALSSE